MKNGVTAMEITKQRAQSGLVSKTLAMRETMTLPSRLSYADLSESSYTSPILISSTQVNTNIIMDISKPSANCACAILLIGLFVCVYSWPPALAESLTRATYTSRLHAGVDTRPLL